MAYCFNPNCGNPNNSDANSFCPNCGSPLRLENRFVARQPIAATSCGRTFQGGEIEASKPYLIQQVYLQAANAQLAREAIARFHQEVQILQQFGQHPDSPALLAGVAADGQLYLIQEGIDGEPLNPDSWQQKENPAVKIRQLLADILPVLQLASDRRLFHRDIRPENIIQRHQDGKFILINFGLSSRLLQVATGKTATSPAYLAPEQIYGKEFAATNLYALGATCLHLLTGCRPEQLYDPLAETWLWRDKLPENVYIGRKLGNILEGMVQTSLKQRSSTPKAILRKLNGISARTTATRSRPATPAASASPTADLHENSINIDYSVLKTQLERGNWQDADEETGRILRQLARKHPYDYLSARDLDRLPCPELEYIDLLWQQASDGHFGFKVQGDIFQEVGREYNLFCDRVGWTTLRAKNEARSFTYNLQAPKGHLPSRHWAGGYTWWKHAALMTEKLIQCHICLQLVDE